MSGELMYDLSMQYEHERTHPSTRSMVLYPQQM
jgi:hypothetical protein